MWLIGMTDCLKGTVIPVLSGIVIALASILVVTQYSYPLPLVALDVEEAIEAENTTMTGTTNQTTTNGNTTAVEFLSIQTAQSGSLSHINDTAYALELDNVSDSTILFADRPNRIVTSVSTSDFVGNWTKGTDSFAADAPNDALIVENTQTGQLETAVIESFTPVYDVKTTTLTYIIMAENATSISLPSEFGQAVLVIDDEGYLDQTSEIIQRLPSDI